MGRRWARQRQGSPGCGHPGGGGTGNAPAPGAGQGTGTAGLVPRAGPTKGHWILQVNQEGGKAFGSAPTQAKPGAPASWGLPIPSTSLLLTLLAQAASWEPLFSSFPFQGQPPAVCPAWRGLQLPPATPYFASSRLSPSLMESQRLFSTVGCSRGVGKSCQAMAAQCGQEQCPAPRALNA